VTLVSSRGHASRHTRAMHSVQRMRSVPETRRAFRSHAAAFRMEDVRNAGPVFLEPSTPGLLVCSKYIPVDSPAL